MSVKSEFEQQFKRECTLLMTFVRIANQTGDYLIEGEDDSFVIPGHAWRSVREQLKKCDTTYVAAFQEPVPHK